MPRCSPSWHFFILTRICHNPVHLFVIIAQAKHRPELTNEDENWNRTACRLSGQP